MDNKFKDKLLRDNEHLSDEEFADLLRGHLAAVDELRKQRRSEKDRLNEKMKADMQQRQKRGSGSEGEGIGE